MTAAFELDGRPLRVPVPDGWEAKLVNGRVRVTHGPRLDLPAPMIEIHIRPADDPRAFLDGELGDLTLMLTDFTVLHVEGRPVRAGNWRGEQPELPFVLGGYRQGIFSLLAELGLVGGDGTDVALALSMCLVEEAGQVQHELDAILNGIEVDWA